MQSSAFRLLSLAVKLVIKDRGQIDMRRYLLAAVAAAAFASPAAAADGAGYIGLEGGLMQVGDIDLEGEFLSGDPIDGIDFLEDDVGALDFKTGIDHFELANHVCPRALSPTDQALCLKRAHCFAQCGT